MLIQNYDKTIKESLAVTSVSTAINRVGKDGVDLPSGSSLYQI
jgi:hypothetical protein